MLNYFTSPLSLFKEPPRGLFATKYFFLIRSSLYSNIFDVYATVEKFRSAIQFHAIYEYWIHNTMRPFDFVSLGLDGMLFFFSTNFRTELPNERFPYSVKIILTTICIFAKMFPVFRDAFREMFPDLQVLKEKIIEKSYRLFANILSGYFQNCSV